MPLAQLVDTTDALCPGVPRGAQKAVEWLLGADQAENLRAWHANLLPCPLLR